MNNTAVLSLKNIHKGYREGAGRLEVLRGLNLEISRGEMVALIGPSGSGKSTLLQIAGLLDVADSGMVHFSGQDITYAKDAERTRIRREKIGFVYQFHHLLPEFNALENVAMPLLVQGLKATAAQSKAAALLNEVGLAERMSHRPSELSGGEQQRVAIARALVIAPELLIADEPTGNLDPETAHAVFALLKNLCARHQLSVLMATHNMELAGALHRTLQLGKT